jgi:hypothetical protein
MFRRYFVLNRRSPSLRFYVNSGDVVFFISRNSAMLRPFSGAAHFFGWVVKRESGAFCHTMQDKSAAAPATVSECGVINRSLDFTKVREDDDAKLASPETGLMTPDGRVAG